VCDVISVVAGFMVGGYQQAGEAGSSVCDVISVVAEFMVGGVSASS
jgi:hypothetical protein